MGIVERGVDRRARLRSPVVESRLGHSDRGGDRGRAQQFRLVKGSGRRKSMSQPSQSTPFLLTPQPRARWMRLDTAQLLKRFYFCERMVLVSCAAWIPAIASLETKTSLARVVWQSAETAHALRNRVFELRFPSRLLEEEGADQALMELFSAVKNSPSVPAFLLSVGKVLLPALRDSYQSYLTASDSIADGPTHRFLSLALTEKLEQIAAS